MPGKATASSSHALNPGMLLPPRANPAPQRVSVTATGSFNLDDEMFDDDGEELETDFTLDAERFAKALDAISNPEDGRAEKRAAILDLANRYYELASGKLAEVRETQRRSSRGLARRFEDEDSQDSMDLDEAVDAIPAAELRALVLEVQTWDFLRRLLPLRYPERKIAQPKHRDPSKFQSSTELWDEFLQHDLTARERKEILEVLQATADETRENIDDMVRDLQENAERGDIIAYGWLHTRSAIKMQKNVNGWTGTLDPGATDVREALIDSTGANPLVTQLDPDVITRQKRKLQPQDEYFERAIWLGCYELLRRGRSLAEIRDWCVERTEVWRAVSMSALPLSRKPDERQTGTNSLALLLWRRTCYSLARQGGTDDYERAVYGILSGDVKTVSPVCGSWDDFVFSQCNALLRSQFDNYVMKRSPREATQSVTQLPVFDAIQSHGDAATISEAWLGSLETKPEISTEALTPIKSLQAAILSDTLDRYIYNEGLVLGIQANQNEASRLIPDYNKSKTNVEADKYFSLTDQNGLRILVHVYLLLSSLGELEAGDTDANLRQSQENALAAYISTLRLNSLVELLPLYCSKLQGDRAFYTLSRNVSKVVDTDERRMLLRIMEQLGMDIAEFVVFQPQSLLQEHPESLDAPTPDGLKLLMDEPPSVRFGRRLIPDFLGETPDELDPVDERLVQSLEWMLLVDGLWDETFATGVAIYKRFLSMLFYSLPLGRIDLTAL
jgi:nuclear pore complex protein Nup107